jgi:anti-sigma regulatory factor (Ser/Thr protein kinase)
VVAVAPQVIWTHEAHFSPGARSVSQARGFVADLLRRHELLLLVDDARLVVSELVTNALVHAHTHITVTLEGRHDGSVRVTVHDDSSATPVARIAAVTDTGGRGLAIVEHYCSEWGFDVHPGHGKSVWAVFAAAAP